QGRCRRRAHCVGTSCRLLRLGGARWGQVTSEPKCMHDRLVRPAPAGFHPANRPRGPSPPRLAVRLRCRRHFLPLTLETIEAITLLAIPNAAPTAHRARPDREECYAPSPARLSAPRPAA